MRGEKKTKKNFSCCLVTNQTEIPTSSHIWSVQERVESWTGGCAGSMKWLEGYHPCFWGGARCFFSSPTPHQLTASSWFVENWWHTDFKWSTSRPLAITTISRSPLNTDLVVLWRSLFCSSCSLGLLCAYQFGNKTLTTNNNNNNNSTIKFTKRTHLFRHQKMNIAVTYRYSGIMSNWNFLCINLLTKSF